MTPQQALNTAIELSKATGIRCTECLAIVRAADKKETEK